MQEAIRSRPDYDPGIQKHSHFRDFELSNLRPLADTLDFLGFHDACRMLAVIFACQLFKSGHEDKDVVAGNSPNFVDRQIDKLQTLADFTAADRHAFSDLRTRLTTARDKMLAHADGNAFDFKEIPAGLRFKLPITSIQELDFDLMLAFLSRLEEAIRLYLRPAAA